MARRSRGKGITRLTSARNAVNTRLWGGNSGSGTLSRPRRMELLKTRNRLERGILATKGAGAGVRMGIADERTRRAAAMVSRRNYARGGTALAPHKIGSYWSGGKAAKGSSDTNPNKSRLTNELRAGRPPAKRGLNAGRGPKGGFAIGKGTRNSPGGPMAQYRGKSMSSMGRTPGGGGGGGGGAVNIGNFKTRRGMYVKLGGMFIGSKGSGKRK